MADDDDRESLPQTEPTAAPIFDTGPYPEPLDLTSTSAWAYSDSDSDFDEPVGEAPASEEPSAPIPATEPELPDSSHISEPEAPEPEAPAAKALVSAPVRSFTVPGQYFYLKWWRLVLVLIGVWIPAGLIGVGLFNFWAGDPSRYKTVPVFVVLIYVIVCTVGGLILAMVQNKPLFAALAIALMSAPFASVVITAPFYGVFYCDHAVQFDPTTRCLVGMIPY